MTSKLPSHFALMLVALYAATVSCSAPVETTTARVRLKGAGSTFVAVLFKQWFNAYQAQSPEVGIQYDAAGSGEGIRRFLGRNLKDETEAVDFGASDAVLNDAQIAEVSHGAVLLPMAASSIVLVYNLPDVGELRLSRKAYAAIFLGEVTRWNDPLIAKTNPGAKLPNLEIQRVVRQDGSGTTFVFTKHLDAISGAWHDRYGALTIVDWPRSPMRAPGNEGVAGRVKQSIGSIGYVAYVYAREAQLPAAALENRDGKFVKATESSSLAALASMQSPENLRSYVPDPSGPDSYPIVSFSWALLYSRYDDPAKRQALHDLFRWCLTNGQAYASGAGYVALPPKTANAALAALNAGAL